MSKFTSFSSRNISNEISYFLTRSEQSLKQKHTSLSLSSEDKVFLNKVALTVSSPISPSLLQEHSLYQSLLQLKENEISTLKTILALKPEPDCPSINKTTNESSLIMENVKEANNKAKLQRERAKNKERLSELKKDNDYLYDQLLSQSIYFKSKLNLIKQSSIDIETHQNAIDSLTIQHKKKSIALLDKLINLKNRLNECEKALNTKSSLNSIDPLSHPNQPEP